MKKSIFLGVLTIIFIVPQLAIAAWWNPLSWFNSRSFPKPAPVQEPQVQVLENRIKELEKKLGNQTITSDDQTEIEFDERIDDKPTVETKPKPTSSFVPATTPVATPQKPATVPVARNVAPITNTITTPVPTPINLEKAHDDLINKFSVLKDRVSNTITNNGYSNTSDLSGITWNKATTLNDINQKATARLYELKMLNPSQKDQKNLDNYSAQYNILETSFKNLGFTASNWSPVQDKNTGSESRESIVEAMRRIQGKIDRHNRFLLEINTNYYSCAVDQTNSCFDPYTPKNPIPQEIKDIVTSAPYSATGGGNTKILSKGTSLAKYTEQQIEFILFDLKATYHQLQLQLLQ